MTSSVADALVGRLIDGRYRILSHLADGGMASVYRAMDARLEREVAVKIMRPGLATDHVFVERFRAEARSAARLSHPNVVAVFDQGEDDGDVFLAMELVEGKTLRDVIHEEAPLTARESLAILEPILGALRAAHAAGIIHRDVKPENVIVRRDGEVKVADFGLARAITNQTTTSQTGVLLGTVSYLSPEQVERGTADQRSDVYAAGLVLFEMLTGRKAVTGDTPIQIAYKHVHGGVPSPSSVVTAVPADLDDLVARATAVEPDDRFESVADFITTLRAVRRGLTPGELDRRGAAPAADGASSRAAEPTRASTPRQGELPSELPPVSRPEPSRARPELSHTTAMPVRQAAATPKRRRRWPWWIAALLAVLAVGGAGWWFTDGPGGTTVVPSVVGQSLDQAVAALDTATLRSDSSEAFSEDVAKGRVIDVDPVAGTELSKQSSINVLVSKGPERYQVPKLVGTKATSAPAALAKVNLKPGPTTTAYDESVKAGLVISQDPAPGTSVRRDVAVSVVVSKGREPITVPTVTGSTAAAAESAVTDAGLTYRRADDVNSDTVPAGRVVSQTPSTGTLFKGDRITVVVSKGPVMVTVPEVVGMPVAKAEAALTAAGLKVEKTYPFGDLFEKLVRVQSIDSGTSVRKGSTIRLTIV